jgi:hypothetical protein
MRRLDEIEQRGLLEKIVFIADGRETFGTPPVGCRRPLEQWVRVAFVSDELLSAGGVPRPHFAGYARMCRWVTLGDRGDR